jgi:transposase-like protein
MDNRLSKLIALIHKLPADKLDETLEYVNGKVEESKDSEPPKPCPHCESKSAVRFGRKGGKQRFRCKSCGRTYVGATKTAMNKSHYGEAVWLQIIDDTIEGKSIDKTASELCLSHQTVFHMRHKILLAMDEMERRSPTMLGGVCECDDTYLLESMKGAPIPDDCWRGPRKHGAKARKRGISNEYVNICTGVERGGKSYSKSIGRATPGSKDIAVAFGGRINAEALVLCAGAKSYGALAGECGCTVESVGAGGNATKGGFYHINTANSFHSYIKDRNCAYRGVATKYLNRYNVLFSKAFRHDGGLTGEIYNMLASTEDNLHFGVASVKTANLLDI